MDHSNPQYDAKLAGENLGPTLVIIAWVFAALSLVVVSIRYYVRLRVIKRFQIDDWFILLTFVLALCNSIFCTISTHFGLGRHIQYLSPEQITLSIKYVYLCEFFSIMSPCFGRISYAFLLLQLVPPTKWPRRFLWTIIWFQAVVDVGTVIVSFSQCQPIHEFWGPNPKDHCWDPKIQEYTGFFQGSVCSLVDLILALFPASLFWKLKMKLSTKISLSILMGLGVFSMACSIKKTIELQAINEKGDPTYAMCDLAIWWTLEAYVVLIAASIPTLRPLMTTISATRTGIGSGKSSGYALRNLHPKSIGSVGKRSKGDGQFFSLGDTRPEWASDERLHVDVGASDSSIVEYRETKKGINKTTSVVRVSEPRE